MTDDLMLSLAALAHMTAAAWDQPGDRLLVVHDAGKWWVPGGHLGELEARGWVLVAGDADGDPDVSVTDKGRYWLSRWEKASVRRAERGRA